MRRPPTRAFAIALAAVAALGGMAWAIATQGPLAPVRVTVVTAAETPVAVSLFGIGTVEARRSYVIGPTAAGRVARVLVDQGDRVAAGQLLAEMDPVDMGERLEAGRAGAERARQLASSAEAGLAEAASRARLAQASAERYADLRRRNFVSEEAVDAKAHEANAAAASLAAARAALAAARDEARRADADLAGTAKTRANLRMTSPVDGVVAARLAEPGSTLVAGQAVLQVVDPTSLRVKVRIDQGRSAGLAPGLPAEVVLRSRPGEVLRGKVERVDLLGDAVAEERTADIAFAEPPANLTIGELAEVTLGLPPAARAMAVPAAAIRHAGGTDGVWLLEQGRTVFRPVALGARSLDGLVQVLAGLKGGETVVVHSSRALAADMRVQVADSLVGRRP